MIADSKSTAGRAFVRSLNILLKFARLYGYEHSRTIEQLDIAWRELQNRYPPGYGLRPDAGRDRFPTCCWMAYRLKAHPPKNNLRSYSPPQVWRAFSSFPSVTQEEIGRFARAFPTGKAKPMELASS